MEQLRLLYNAESRRLEGFLPPPLGSGSGAGSDEARQLAVSCRIWEESAGFFAADFWPTSSDEKALKLIAAQALLGAVASGASGRNAGTIAIEGISALIEGSNSDVARGGSKDRKDRKDRKNEGDNGRGIRQTEALYFVSKSAQESDVYGSLQLRPCLVSEELGEGEFYPATPIAILWTAERNQESRGSVGKGRELEGKMSCAEVSPELFARQWSALCATRLQTLPARDATTIAQHALRALHRQLIETHDHTGLPEHSGTHPRMKPLSAAQVSILANEFSMRRLRTFVSTGMEESLIADLWLPLALAYFHGRFHRVTNATADEDPLLLAPLEAATLLALGLQRKSVARTAKELEVTEALVKIRFKLAIKQLLKFMEALLAEDVTRQVDIQLNEAEQLLSVI